tara:strand:- start:5 stop:643 length:639 start_codon:yes stop_codon:yes gene_type:complete
MSKVNVNTIEPSTGTDITLGASGDTITVPSGATFTQSGTMNASAITAGTLAIARGGTGAATLAAAGLTNAPSFVAYRNSTQSITSATNTIMVFNTEAYDTNSAYNTTDGKFTVPVGEGGKYFFSSTWIMAGMGDGTKNTIALWKNGSSYTSPYFDYDSNSPTASTYLYNRIIGILTLSAGDYVQINAYQNTGGTVTTQADQNHFAGYKLIGV